MNGTFITSLCCYKEYSNQVHEKIEEKINVERITFLDADEKDVDEAKTIYKIEDFFKLEVLEVRNEKGKFIKVYVSNLKTRKFKEGKIVEEEIFVSRLYNNEGDLIGFKKQSNCFKLMFYSDFKLLTQTKKIWTLVKKENESQRKKVYISDQIYDTLKQDYIGGKCCR